jgi:diguanylate cyclase (GGDEF)-like protein
MPGLLTKDDEAKASGNRPALNASGVVVDPIGDTAEVLEWLGQPKPPQLSQAIRILTAPATLFGAVAALWIVLLLGNWDIFKAMTMTDAAHPGWFVEEDLIAMVAMGFAWMVLMIRRSHDLRQEINRRRRAEDRAKQLARHDPLTGLPNRRLFREITERVIAGLRHDGTVAAMLVDLDGFKTTNDVHGHAVGDDLLCQSATRLSNVVGDDGTVARLGGDEFVVVTKTDFDKATLARIADRIVLALAEPFFVQDRRLVISASVGIGICPSDGGAVSLLLRAADLAMYRAKDAGRGTFRFFEPEMDVTLREQAALKMDLQDAIAAGQIVPYYQPLIDLATLDVDGFEVLARWEHPVRGLLGPDKFIPLAENMKLITLMTLALFRRVCADARDWPTHYRLSLNISPTQLTDADLFIGIAAMMREAGIVISRLEVELTESSLIKDTKEAGRIIDGLRATGITVALDDFGTGYSSLFHLREIHFDKVKIDRSFVQNIGRDPRAASYVEAMIGLGRSLHLQTTAEGIEDPEALARLVEMGCTFGQGFIFAKPMSGQDTWRSIRQQVPHNPEIHWVPLATLASVA